MRSAKCEKQMSRDPPANRSPPHPVNVYRCGVRQIPHKKGPVNWERLTPTLHRYYLFDYNTDSKLSIQMIVYPFRLIRRPSPLWRWSSSATRLPSDFDLKPSFRLTRSPNPQWDLGDGVNKGAAFEEWNKEEEKGWKSWKTEDVPGR